MRNILKYKLFYQVFSAVVLSSLFLSVVGCLIMIHNSTRHLTEEVKLKYTYLVQDHTHKLENNLEKREEKIGELCKHIQRDFEMMDYGSIDRHIQLMNDKYRSELVDMIDNEGIYDTFMITKSNALKDSVIITSHDHPTNKTFAEVKDLVVKFSEFNNRTLKGAWVDQENMSLLVYVHPIVIDEHVVGYIGARFRTFYVFRETAKLIEQTKSNLVIYDRHKKAIFASNYAERELAFNLGSVEEHLQSNNFGIYEVSKDTDVEYISAYSKLENDWLVVMNMTKRDVLRRTYELYELMIMYFIIVSVFSVFIALTLSTMLTEPISDLANEVERIGDGNYETSLPKDYMSYNNEIGVLAKTIESMRLSLFNYIREIEVNAENLEMQVEERTRELVTSNEYLEESLAEIQEKRHELIEVNEALEITLKHLQETQSQLIESQKLAALTDLVSGVAHQLNTPIGTSVTIATYLEKEFRHLCVLLNEKYDLDEASKELSQEITQSAEMTIKNLSKARDILDAFKYLTVNSSNEKPIEMEINEFFDDLTTALMARAEYNKYKLDFSKNEDILMTTYPSILTQVMTQLISNTILHGFETKEDGIISINIKDQGDTVRIDYRDNGVGISNDIMGRIFDPFYTSKMGKDRLGLGLSIAYNHIVYKLKGSIKCESTYGIGTHFSIELPKTY